MTVEEAGFIPNHAGPGSEPYGCGEGKRVLIACATHSLTLTHTHPTLPEVTGLQGLWLALAAGARVRGVRPKQAAEVFLPLHMRSNRLLTLTTFIPSTGDCGGPHPLVGKIPLPWHFIPCLLDARM